jgi:hypothetical protein
VLNNLPWNLLYHYDSQIIRYICIQNRKASGAMISAQKSVVTIHTTVPWAVENWRQGETDLYEMIMNELGQVVPGLDSCTPESHLLHYWESGQVTRPIQGPFADYNSATFLPKKTDQSSVPAPLLFVGDYLEESKFRQCLLSAYDGACDFHRAFLS